MQISAADSGRSVTVHIGDELLVSLPENPTTGYRWQLDPPSDPLVLEEDRFLPAGGAGIGAGGTRSLTFRATAAGQAHLHLALRREWETDKPPTQDFSLFVEVSNQRQGGPSLKN